MSIGPKLDSPAIDAMAASESKFTLEFPDLCFPYISWVNDSPAILFHPIFPIPAINLPQSNSDINENNETIPSNSKDELSPSSSSSKQSPAPSTPSNFKENSALQSQ